MKKCLLLALLLMLFILAKTAYAEPVIENVSLQPRNIWTDENISISLDCYESSNGSITQVYGKFTDPLVSETLKFGLENNHYILRLTNLHLEPNTYTFSIYCQDDTGNINSTSVSFNVSQISATIVSLKSPIYLGDKGELIVSIKKDGYPLSDGISFNLKLGGQNWSKISFYNPQNSNWIIQFDPPNVLGIYDLNLEIYVNLDSYNPRKIEIKSSVEVKDIIDFNILYIDKTEVRPNDTVTISLSASEKGNGIILSKDYLSFQIGSTTLDNVTITSAGDHFDAKILMPNLSPGSYELKITLNYENISISRTTNIYYVMPISGKFVDLNNKGINVEIKFFVGNTEKKRFVTDGSGSYSGYIVPGVYTIQLNFPQSTLYLYDAEISSFDDPIKYYFLDTDIEGIKTAGLFVYESKIPFKYAIIVMNYDEGRVNNENNIVVYKCREFNPSNKICNNGWEEEVATIDSVRNSITVTTTSLSAYAVGTRKSLYIDFSSEKTIFSVNEPIRIRGIVRDESGNFVKNALVNASIYPTNIKMSTYSDSNGVFTLEFFAPGDEGVYSILLRAEKSPYISSNKSWSFQVLKTRSISLVVPDTIRIKRGENLTLQFSLVNTGQVDLSNLSVSLIGLPKEYFSLQDRIDELKIGQEVKIPIYFKIPKDAAESTTNLTFRVSSNEIIKEEIIGFTVFSENTTVPSAQTSSFFSHLTAYFTSPVSLSDVTYASVFGAVIISTAYILGKMKKEKVRERENVKNLLLGIKNEIKRKNNKPA